MNQEASQFSQYAFVLRCVHPQIQWPVNAHLEKLGFKERCFTFSEFGGTHSVAIAPSGERTTKAKIFRDLATLYVLGVRTVLLYHHRDCRAYQGLFDYRGQEVRLHQTHLEVCGKWLTDTFSGINVRGFFVDLDPEGKVIEIPELVSIAGASTFQPSAKGEI